MATVLNSGGTFESATKLQKLAFLSIYENGMECFAEFHWHYYGPFSRELEDAIEDLKREELLVEQSLNRTSYSGNEYTVKKLSLTPRGKAVASIIITEMSAKNKAALDDTMDEYGSKPLSKILEYVYNAYNPEDL
ncbi:MAG: hypothetical protein ABSG33_02905 [Candidatus Bathyarchaeia archaeon]